MFGGTVYGVVLNDEVQLEALGSALCLKPYGAPPVAPVVYIKPRNCVSVGGAAVPIPSDLTEVEVAATIALLFGDIPRTPSAAALAVDVCEPHQSYYRPAIRQRCRDGFLPVGAFAPYAYDALLANDIVTAIDGVEAHRWSLQTLHRDVPTLIEAISQFLTFAPGDVLLVGLPGNAPRVRPGCELRVSHGTLPTLATRCVVEAAA